MHKTYFLLSFVFLIFTQSCFGETKINEEKTMQIIAENVEQNGSIITAIGNIVVISPNYFLKSDKAIYDRDSATMELFGNVSISKNKETISISNYAFLDMKNEINNAMPILLLDNKTNVWINAKTINKKSDLNIIKDATLSSCECSDPTWSIGFTSGDYNTTNQWINTYNNTLYVHDIPVWYLLFPAIPYVSLPNLAAAYLVLRMPYMGFSTNKERRSGLLKPQFGYGQTDGFFYAQPIYYAPQKNVDYEYIPQIRTNRGSGHEVKVRFADSPYSTFELDGGIFIENNKYFEENKLKNKNHYGGVLKYDRTKLFANNDSTDGFYLFLQKMNDIEYENTKYNNNNDILVTNKILESKVKYFYDTPSHNTYIEAINYNNIQTNNNDEVMQVTPSVGFHKYSDSLFFDKLHNSIDFKYKKQHRTIGLGADTFDLKIPFSYSKYLIEDYLLFSYEKSLNLHKINYTNDALNPKKDGTLINSKDRVSIEIDLLKPYATKIHTVNFNAQYEKSNYIKENGGLYGINSIDDPDLQIFPITKDTENITLSFNQSLFNKDNLSTIFNHKVNQKILFDENGTSRLDNLENELTVYLPYTTISNRSLFNHDEKFLISSTSTLNFQIDNFFTKFDYSFAKDTTSKTDNMLYKHLPDTESITSNIGTKVFKYYTLAYKEQYDLIQHNSKIKEYKMTIDKKCWSLNLLFQDSLVATATDSAKARRQNIVYATITLKPIFSFSQKFTLDKKEE